MAPPAKHTVAEDECEHRHNDQGALAWVRRNLSIPAILAILGMLGAVFVAISGFTSKVEQGAQAAVTVKVIEHDYVSKRDLEQQLQPIRNEQTETRREIRDLTRVILKRLPD